MPIKLENIPTELSLGYVNAALGTPSVKVFQYAWWSGLLLLWSYYYALPRQKRSNLSGKHDEIQQLYIL